MQWVKRQAAMLQWLWRLRSDDPTNRVSHLRNGSYFISICWKIAIYRYGTCIWSLLSRVSPHFTDTTKNSELLLLLSFDISSQWRRYDAVAVFGEIILFPFNACFRAAAHRNEFICQFYFSQMKEERKIYIKERLFTTNLMVSMHRRTRCRFNMMPSLSSDVLWPIVICTSTSRILSILFILYVCVAEIKETQTDRNEKKEKLRPYWVSANNTKNNK